jgi:hypothetical protein
MWQLFLDELGDWPEQTSGQQSGNILYQKHDNQEQDYRLSTKKTISRVWPFFCLLLVVSSGNFLIVDDFIIHNDGGSNSTAIKFQSILLSISICPLSAGPWPNSSWRSHARPDLSRKADNVVTDYSVSDLIFDNFAVHTFVKAHRPPRPRKKISYRELHNINEENFSDMLALPLFTAKAPNIGDRLIQYNKGLSSLLDAHAPVWTKMVTISPENLWLTAQIGIVVPI